MDASQIYILIAILALLLIVIFLFVIKKNKNKPELTPLTGMAFILIISGMFFNDRTVAYPLFGIGVLLAIADMVKKLKK